MTRVLIAVAMTVLVGTAAWLIPNAIEARQTAQDNLIAKVKQNPNDTELLNAYLTQAFGVVNNSLATDVDAAENKLTEVRTLLDELEPIEAEAQQLRERGLSFVEFLAQQVTLARISLDDLETRIRANVADIEALNLYAGKVSMDLGSLAFEDARAAMTLIDRAETFLNEIKKDLTGQDGGAATIEQAIAQIDRFKPNVASALKREELVGQQAIPLKITTWVNGPTIDEDELKGKVVLLDFWAVWCGPCIATFPHLIEWNEKYGEDGLVILGLTQYYNYTWDAQAGRAVPSREEVSPTQEQAMLEQFAASYELTHRFGIMQDQRISEFYGVEGIPQAVLIDRQSKIRMIRVGSGDANTEALDAKIQELLAEPASQ